MGTFKAGVALSLTFACVAMVEARPVRNAFINRRVGNTADLLRQIKTDPEVANRYMRHFGMTRPQLLAYLGGLHRDSLRQAGDYTVYSVPKGGSLKMHHERLPKGEPIFADASGEPVLIAKCGNPLTLGPQPPAPVETFHEMPVNETLTSTEDLAFDPVSTINLASLPPDVPLIVESATPFLPLAPLAGSTVPVPFLSLIGAGATALGGASFFFGGSGHAVQAVPEVDPSMLLALSAGASYLVSRSRRGKRSDLR